MTPSFTLVSTVFNESDRLDRTLADLNAQTLQPNEVIITDAGSTDGTYEKLLAFAANAKMPVNILQEPKCNVAKGRNLAIKAATNPIILSTDFGCRFHPIWMESIIAPFNNPGTQVVGGAYAVIEAELTTEAEKVAYVLSNGYQFDAKADYFVPSSRSIAYKKEVFEKVGGYSEWLTLAADDLIFGMQIKKLGIPIVIVDRPLVYWGRHRKYIGYGKETFRYGLGDGEARIKYNNFLKYLVFIICRLLFVAGIIVAATTQRFSVLLITLVFSIGFIPYYHHLKNWLRLKSSKYNFSIFVKGIYMLELTHYNYLKGYINGYYYSSPGKKENAETLKRFFAGGYTSV